ncbi:variable surface protein [Plasmodium gonderi]|uniref:Variable surface protein n=1 Tax=Plasmodium gonderi TaxID=77519 RepID=A0A1Y1JVQ1_PLAGO|nr:variable surface protein [Plasmodium gonderi]GAW83964.1 variable surface protein [Plasmodium gonderi]
MINKEKNIMLMYNLVKYFPKCNKIIVKYEEPLPSGTHPCTNGFIGANHELKQKFKGAKCSAAINFAYNIMNNSDEVNNDALCFFLYYWLYKVFKASDIVSTSAFSIYKAILSHVSSGNTLCKKYIRNSITDYELALLNILSDLYKTFNNINDSEEWNTEDSFLFELKYIISEYKKGIEEQYSNIDKSQISTPCQNNKAFTFIIPLVLILTTFFILLIIYRFTSYGSYILSGIKRIRNKWNNKNEKWAINKSYEISSNIPSDMRYILYI